jgi:transcription elongation factor S-II
VGKLRTHEDKSVADLAKETVKKWKNDVAAQKEKPAATAGSTTEASRQSTVIPKSGTTKAMSPTAPTKVSSATNAPGTFGVGETQSSNASVNGTTTPAGKNRDATSDGIAEFLSKDTVRNSCITLLYNAIVLESTECTVPCLAKLPLPLIFKFSPLIPAPCFLLPLLLSLLFQLS